MGTVTHYSGKGDFEYTLSGLKTFAEILNESSLNADTIIQESDFVHITVRDNDIVYLLGGGTPTSTFGHVISGGGSEYFYGTKNFRNLKVIPASGSATLTITYGGI